MTPIDLKEAAARSERDAMMVAEIQAFIVADVDAAELWKDTNVTDGRNVDLYKSVLRRMRLSDCYEMCQRKGKIIIKEKRVVPWI